MAVLITEADVHALLSIPAAMDIAEGGYRIFGTERQVVSTPSAAFMIYPGNGPAAVPRNFWIKGAYSRELGVAGVSLGAQFGEHYFMVVDGASGALRGVIERSFMSKRRTGATAGVAARHLARADSRVAALIGAGQIGEQAVRAVAAAFALDEFRIASRTLGGAQAFATRLQPDLTIPLRAVASAEAAIRGADIIVTITVAEREFVEPGWLKRGALLLSMGGVAEVGFGVLAEVDRLIVDDIDYAALRGDFAAWIRQGHISRTQIDARLDADIGEVVCGDKPGRIDPQENILAVIQGMTICDLAIAHWLIGAAERQGVGFDWQVGHTTHAANGEKLARDSHRIAQSLQPRAKD
jgi:alanine dehydrogenase